MKTDLIVTLPDTPRFRTIADMISRKHFNDQEHLVSVLKDAGVQLADIGISNVDGILYLQNTHNLKKVYSVRVLVERSFYSDVLCKSYKTITAWKVQLRKYINAQTEERDWVSDTKSNYYFGEPKIKVLHNIEYDILRAKRELKRIKEMEGESWEQ